MARPQLASPCCTPASQEERRLGCPRFTPSVQKQAEGRNTKGQMWLNVFASGENCANYAVFINAGGSCGGRRRPDFLLNLNVAGCTEPICHQNNRRAETYMTLATDGSLVSWSTVGPHCETHLFSCRFLHHLNVCLFLRVTIILFWCKELAWQSDISTDFSAPQKPQIALETRRIKQVHHKEKKDLFKWIMFFLPQF